MACDLDRLFSSIRRALPQAEDQCFTIRAGVVPEPSPEMRTDRIVIEKSYSNYNSVFRRDRLFFHADKASYCNLALLTAAVLFRFEGQSVTLHLDHPASNIRRLVVRPNRPDLDAAGYQTAPLVLNYYPEAADKHPWAFPHIDPYTLPAFLLTNTEEMLRSEAEWERRDVVIGFGRDAATARLVELLFNMSREASTTNEVELEGEGGFRGVAPFSCDATFLLPGAFGWTESYWV
jgi:hypothetical protein